MSRWSYYEKLKALAREQRAKHGLSTPRVLRSDLRRIYRAQGIVRVDLWRHKFKHLRGAYFCDDLGPTVMLAASLPEEPRIFTMAHELKHHLVDQGVALSYCASTNENEEIEIGAEVFAAELIFPDAAFKAAMAQRAIGAGACTAEGLVHTKRETTTTLSYAGLVKKAEWLGFAKGGSLQGVKWKKLEEALYGEPVYKRILRSRSRRLG